MRFLADVHRGGECCRRRRQILVRWSVVTVGMMLAVWQGRCVRAREDDSPSARTYRVVLDLSRKDTFVTLRGRPATTQLVRLKANDAPCRYRLRPETGVVRHGQDVVVMLDEFPQVHIRISLVTRGKTLAARISPLIAGERGTAIEFTHDRIQRAIWAFDRRVKDLQKQIAASRQEYQRLDTWLDTPGNKPLDLHKTVRLRQKLLAQRIASCHRELPAAQCRYEAMRSLVELAVEMDGKTAIQFTVE